MHWLPSLLKIFFSNSQPIEIEKNRGWIDDAKNSPVGSVSAAYQLALNQREFEITQLTNRNNFFMIFQGVLLAAIVQSQRVESNATHFLICMAGMAISLYQAGMASGAKYWQIRWESAVKELELQLLEQLKDEEKVMQLFSVDAQHLSLVERGRIEEINKVKARQNDKLSVQTGYVDGLISADLNRSGKSFSIIKFAIRCRFSVSKIPIWVGLTLFVLWFLLCINTFTINNRLVLNIVFDYLCPGFFDWFAFTPISK